MWPFNKKEHECKEPGCDSAEGIAKLQEFKKIGETFNYLGRTCIVTGHCEHMLYLGDVPLLKFDYADNMGRLHRRTASVAELPALMNQQLPNAKLTSGAHCTKTGELNMGQTENDNKAAGAPSALNVGLGTQDIVYRILNDQPSYEKDIEAAAEIKHLESLLNPAWWSSELRDEFIKKMPDVQAAFDSIRGGPNV